MLNVWTVLLNFNIMLITIYANCSCSSDTFAFTCKKYNEKSTKFSKLLKACVM